MRACIGSGIAPSVLHVLPRRGHDLVAHFRERARDHRSRGALVPAAAELPREPVHVHAAGAAEAHLHLSVPEVAEEERAAGAMIAGSLTEVRDKVIAAARTYVENGGGDA